MYDISLDNFQGPMDLLLHLIKKKKMNILDIKLEIIIDEYLNYIKHIKMNLNVASSYLVMASELIEIKSRMLLPNAYEDDYEEDPKEALVNRLVEYEKYKNMVPIFQELENERSNYKTKSPSSILEYKEEKKYNSNLSMEDLIVAYKSFLERLEDEKPIKTKVTKKEISVNEQIKNIRNKLKQNKKFDFFSLFETRNKEYIVVTFLAILEMSRQNEIRIMQEGNFTNIMIEVAE